MVGILQLAEACEFPGYSSLGVLSFLDRTHVIFDSKHRPHCGLCLSQRTLRLRHSSHFGRKFGEHRYTSDDTLAGGGPTAEPGCCLGRFASCC